MMDRMYKATPDGYCGDEDNGQTSAWYVFSAMGFYPVTPATSQFVIGAPLFRKVTLRLENGNVVEIAAPENSRGNKYVSRITLNGKEHDKNWLDHQWLQKGGKISFDMQRAPYRKRGIAPAAYPFSLTLEDQ